MLKELQEAMELLVEGGKPVQKLVNSLKIHNGDNTTVLIYKHETKDLTEAVEVLKKSYQKFAGVQRQLENMVDSTLKDNGVLPSEPPSTPEVPDDLEAQKIIDDFHDELQGFYQQEALKDEGIL
jgi:hypothetical protein